MRAFVTGGSGFVGGALVRRLLADGWQVRALARSQVAAGVVARAGADPVDGDLGDVSALAEGARGCQVAFHAAAHTKEWGRREDFVRVNVGGTRNVVEACRRAGVRRLIHVSTEAALLAGRPLVNVNEDSPLRPDSPSPYCATKAMAEQVALDGNNSSLETVVVRPRFVWGAADQTVLPAIVEAVRRRRFRWIDGGRHLTATTHVQNAVEGFVLAAGAGRPGHVYFVTDGDPVIFRDFVEQLLATQGVAAPDSSVPPVIARGAAVASEAVWSAFDLRGTPPVTRLAVWLASLECTIDIGRARAELGYAPTMTRAQGLAELDRLASGPA